MDWLAVLIVIGGGLTLGVGSYFAHQRRQQLLAVGCRTRGVVVRHQLQCSRVATVTECIVRFTTAQGRLVEAAPPHGITTIVPAYPVGAEVTVVYDEADPADFIVL